jgi:asparagine synthase (glutamine-hydrolysing)
VSAFAGLVHPAGRPLDLARLRTLAVPAPGNTVDALDVWCDEGVGFAQALARVTPEATAERQPLVDAPSGCAIVFDGRVDNRDDLQAALGEYDRLLSQRSDAAYALAAYLRWDRDVARHLLGDFAFGVWDPRVQRLLLARDPAGARLLYYTCRTDGVAFASTLEQLLAEPTLPRDLDEATVLWFLYDHVSPLPGRTYYRDVRLVPAGYTLEVGAGQARLARYWSWPDAPPERSFTDERDAEELRALMVDAVRCRLRSAGPVAVTLSGGLDSGAVACVAGFLHAKDGATPIHAYSTVFERFASCDERPYSTACAARFGFPHTCVPADDCWTLSGFDHWRPVFTEPFLGAYDDTQLTLLSRVRADGCRVVMSGHGGDSLFTGSPDYLSDWLVRGRLGALHAQARARARARRRSYLLALADGAVRPLLPPAVQARVLASRSLRPAGARAWLPPHIEAQFRPATHRRLHWGPGAWWRGLRDSLAGLGQTPNGALWDRMARRFGLELRHPLLDARLVAFVLRTPPDAFHRDGVTKWLLRSSLRDLLPPLVRDRTDKADFTPLSIDGLRRRRAFLEALLADSELERRSYVRPDAWRNAILDHLRRDDAPLPWAIWRSLTLEMWLRAREHRLPALA